MKLVQAWIEIHQDELIANWELAIRGESIYKIDLISVRRIGRSTMHEEVANHGSQISGNGHMWYLVSIMSEISF
jgi:hypothetical protein